MKKQYFIVQVKDKIFLPDWTNTILASRWTVALHPHLGKVLRILRIIPQMASTPFRRLTGHTEFYRTEFKRSWSQTCLSECDRNGKITAYGIRQDDKCCDPFRRLTQAPQHLPPALEPLCSAPRWTVALLSFSRKVLRVLRLMYPHFLPVTGQRREMFHAYIQ